MFKAQAQGTVLNLAVFPDHERLFSRDASGSIQVWDPRSGQELCRRKNVPIYIHHLAVSADGSRIVGIDRSTSVVAWDTQSLTPVVEAAPLERYAALLGRATEVRKQRFSVYTKSGVEIYLDGGKVCARWPNLGPVVPLVDESRLGCTRLSDTHLAISDDGLYTAVMVASYPVNAPSSSRISIFETEHLLRAPEWTDPDDPYAETINSWGCAGCGQEMVLSPDGQTLAVLWLEGIGLTIWDFRKGTFATYGPPAFVPVDTFAFLGNNRLVVVRGNEIEVLDLERKAV